MLSYPMRYVSLFCMMLILTVVCVCVNLYSNKADRVCEEKEFSTTDYLTWGDWTQGIRDYISRCTDGGERVASYLSLQNPNRDEKVVFDLGHAAWKEGKSWLRLTMYVASNGVWVIDCPYSFFLDCPQGRMTFCASMTMPEFIPWSDFGVLLDRFCRMENYYVDIAVESSLSWEQCWVAVKKLYDVVGMDRLVSMAAWENVSFCRECVSPALPPAPGTETDIITVVQTLAELVHNNYKEDSADVQKLLGELYRLKQMYPMEFFDIVKTRTECLKNIHYSFLEMHNKN